MTVVTRSVLWSKEVPRGFKVVNIRQGSTVSTFYLSPEGKRFLTLEAAKEHIASQLADLSDTDGNEFIHSPRRRKRKRSGESTSGSKRLKLDNEVIEDNDAEKETFSLPIEIQRRRKLMAARSPFRNLLKRTLVRNHVRTHGRGSWKNRKAPPTPAQSPQSQTPTVPAPAPSSPSSITSFSAVSPVAVKKRKCYDPPESPVTSQVSKGVKMVTHELPETPPKSKPELLMTPPRNPRRESMLFTPPNLTPPVSRRNPSVSFTSPNQRPLSARTSRAHSNFQPNFNI